MTTAKHHGAVRATRAKACTGKVRHANRSSAQKHLDHLVAGGAARDGLNCYECRHCGGFHIGHIKHR